MPDGPPRDIECLADCHQLPFALFLNLPFGLTFHRVLRHFCLSILILRFPLFHLFFLPLLFYVFSVISILNLFYFFKCFNSSDFVLSAADFHFSASVFL